MRPGLAHGLAGVGGGQDPAGGRDRRPGQAPVVAGPVQPLAGQRGDRADPGQRRRAGQGPFGPVGIQAQPRVPVARLHMIMLRADIRPVPFPPPAPEARPGQAVINRHDAGMTGPLHHVVLDCPDPASLAEFYSELLGQPVTYRSEDWVVVAATTPRLDCGSGLDLPGRPVDRRTMQARAQSCKEGSHGTPADRCRSRFP